MNSPAPLSPHECLVDFWYHVHGVHTTFINKNVLINTTVFIYNYMYESNGRRVIWLSLRRGDIVADEGYPRRDYC